MSQSNSQPTPPSDQPNAQSDAGLAQPNAQSDAGLAQPSAVAAAPPAPEAPPIPMKYHLVRTSFFRGYTHQEVDTQEELHRLLKSGQVPPNAKLLVLYGTKVDIQILTPQLVIGGTPVAGVAEKWLLDHLQHIAEEGED